MLISATELGRYRQQVSAVRDAAAGYVLSRVLAECAWLGTAEAREAAKGIVTDAADAFGMQAQALACGFFDEVAQAHGLDVRARVQSGLTDPADVDRNVRYFARRLEGGDLAGFARDCAARAAFYVWREANLCVAQNTT